MRPNLFLFSCNVLLLFYIRDLLDEVNADPDFKITQVVCDMVERHYIKGLSCIAAAYGCEFCIAKAFTKQKGAQWPFPDTVGHPERTAQGMIEVARQV